MWPSVPSFGAQAEPGLGEGGAAGVDRWPRPSRAPCIPRDNQEALAPGPGELGCRARRGGEEEQGTGRKEGGCWARRARRTVCRPGGGRAGVGPSGQPPPPPPSCPHQDQHLPTPRGRSGESCSSRPGRCLCGSSRGTAGPARRGTENPRVPAPPTLPPSWGFHGSPPCPPQGLFGGSGPHKRDTTVTMRPGPVHRGHSRQWTVPTWRPSEITICSSAQGASGIW